MEHDALVTIGSLIKAERERSQTRLTQEDAAERIGVTQQTIGRWEKGISVPYPEHLPAIAKFLPGIGVRQLREMRDAEQRARENTRPDTATRLAELERQAADHGRQLDDLRLLVTSLLARVEQLLSD